MGCGGGSKPPAPDPSIGQAALAQAGLAKESFDFFKQAYSDNMARQGELDKQTSAINEQLLSDSKKQSARGDEQYDFYMKNGRPMLERSLEDAKNVDSEGNIASERGRAMADVAQAGSNAQESNMRSMARFGIRPNAERMAAISSQIGAQMAAAQAGAATNSERGLKDRGVAMRANAVNMTAGMPGQALTFNQAGAGANQQVLGNMGGANQSAMGFQNQFGGGMGQSAGMYGQAAQTMQSRDNYLLKSWQAKQDGNNSTMSGIGQLAGMGMMMMSSEKTKENNAPVDDHAALKSLTDVPVEAWNYKGNGQRHIGPMAEDMNGAAGETVAPGGVGIDVVSNLGQHHAAIRAIAQRLDALDGGSNRDQGKFADGGKIVGPGTGVSDSIPAQTDTGKAIRVSNGEYIVPADVVRKLGTEHFDRLTAKHHTPAAQQRAAIRR